MDAIYREIVASLYNLVRSNLSQSQLVRTMAGNSRLQGIRECFESFAHSMKAADCSVTLSTLLLGGTSSHGLGDNDYAFLDSRNGLEVDRSVASTLNGKWCSMLERARATGIHGILEAIKTQKGVGQTQIGSDPDLQYMHRTKKECILPRLCARQLRQCIYPPKTRSWCEPTW